MYIYIYITYRLNAELFISLDIMTKNSILNISCDSFLQTCSFIREIHYVFKTNLTQSDHSKCVHTYIKIQINIKNKTIYEHNEHFHKSYNYFNTTILMINKCGYTLGIFGSLLCQLLNQYN